MEEGMTERVDRVVEQMHETLGAIVKQADQAAVLPERVEGINQQAQTAFETLASCAKQLAEVTGRYEAVISTLEVASQRLGERTQTGCRSVSRKPSPAPTQYASHLRPLTRPSSKR